MVAGVRGKSDVFAEKLPSFSGTSPLVAEIVGPRSAVLNYRPVAMEFALNRRTGLAEFCRRREPCSR